MLQLLDPFAGQLKFFVRSFLGFLDEGMNNDDAFTQQETVEGAANSRAPTRPQFKQSVAKSFGVGKAKAGTMLGQEFD